MGMEGKVCVVTGANSGIGLETARALARMGATVVMTGRDRARTEAAVEDVRRTTGGARVVPLIFDLGSFASVRAAAADLLARHARLDVLVNNAGLILTERKETEGGLEGTFAINHLGPFLFTNLLLDRLKASAPARIVNVSSDAHRRAGGLDFDDLQGRKSYSGLDAYSKSKLANIYFTVELARRLDPEKVTANALHPGVVRSGFALDGDMKGVLGLLLRVARPFMIGPEKGAATSIYLASSPEVVKTTGRYFEKCREVGPSRAAQDADAARRLWDESAKLTQLAAAAP